jgi:hypothetical protein
MCGAKRLEIMLKFQSTKELAKPILIRMIWDVQGAKSHKSSGHLQPKRFVTMHRISSLRQSLALLFIENQR